MLPLKPMMQVNQKLLLFLLQDWKYKTFTFFIIEHPLMFNVPDISNITSISNTTRITIQGYTKGLL